MNTDFQFQRFSFRLFNRRLRGFPEFFSLSASASFQLSDFSVSAFHAHARAPRLIGRGGNMRAPGHA
jgi:hypothetical protein